MSNQRINQLDGIRALAILAVFIHHSLQVKLLWMGVDLFFVLSGFLITGVLLDAKRQSLKRFLAHFYSRRARRILAPYVVMLAFASCVLGVAWMRHWYLYIFLMNLLLPLSIPHPGPFHTLWSLAVEEQFYLLWPFAVYFLNDQRLRHLCILIIVLAPILRGSIHFEYYWPIYTLTPFRMDLLATGGLLCLEWRSRRESIQRWGAWAGAVLVLAGLAGILVLSELHYSTPGNTRTGNVLIYESSLFIASGLMIYALGGRCVRWLQFGVLAYIGQVSYSMYLVHLLLISLVRSRFNGIVAALIAFGMTLTYASICWSVFERPLLGRNRPRTQPTMTRA